jgi:hypothetical protein
MQLTLPPQTRYDQAARFLIHQTGGLFFQWLLRKTAQQVSFSRWRTAPLTLPGVADRLCDGIAELADQERGGLPFAALLEVQTQPDATMPGRLMLAGGLVWLTLRPSPLPGDRFELLGVVLNLTGTGNAARECVLGTARWILKPVEVDFETLDARIVLAEIAAGTAPPELLAFLPLMQSGDDPAIIARWREMVGAETDQHRRGSYALAKVFAERAGRRSLWEAAMEDLNMIESPLIAELLAGARIEGKIEMLVRIVKRLPGQPDAVLATIRACTNSDQIDRWWEAALEATSVEDFRQRTGL